MVATVGRIRRLTVQEINDKFQAEARAREAYYARHPEEIEQRLRELDEEWDIERAIELESATTVMTGFVLGATLSKKWFLLSVLASGMLLLHNLKGNYPLLPLFRRLGLRSAQEIAQERYTLKALRGDFRHLSAADDASQVHQALQAAHPTPGSVEPSPFV